MSSLDSLENEIPQQDQNIKPICLDQPKNPDTRGSSALQSEPLNVLSQQSNSCPRRSFLKEILSQQSHLCSSSSSSHSPDQDSTDEDKRLQSSLQTADRCSSVEYPKTSNIQCTSRTQQTLVDHLGSKDFLLRPVSSNTQLKISRSNLDSAELRLKIQPSQETRETLFNGSSNLLQDFSCTGLVIDRAEPASACQSAKTKQYVDSHQASEKETKLHTERTEKNERSAELLENRLDHKSKNVHFLKGILKTKSKSWGDLGPKFIYPPAQFIFRKEVANAIRDSFDLRNKSKASEDKCMKKKLRWVDEVNINWVESGEKSKWKSSNQANPEIRPDLQVSDILGYINVPSSISKTDLVRSGSASSSTTKQVWSDTERQHDPSEMRESSRVQKNVPPFNGCCVSRRVRLTRNVSAPGSFRTKRGTMIRTQSASQLQNLVRTQGKSLMPHPPTRSDGNSRTASNNESPHSQRDVYTNFVKGRTEFILRPEESGFAPVPPSSAYMSETMSKSIYSQGEDKSRTSKGTNSFQNGICLNRTPTDEEITRLWNGVQNALASNDGNVSIFHTKTIKTFTFYKFQVSCFLFKPFYSFSTMNFFFFSCLLE